MQIRYAWPYFVFRQIRGADSHIPDASSGSCIHSRLDYGNAVLVGIPAYLVRRLQSVLNARHDSSTICARTTTTLMRWRHCIVAALQQGAPGQMTWLEDWTIHRPGSALPIA